MINFVGISTDILNDWFDKAKSGDLNEIKKLIQKYPDIINKKDQRKEYSWSVSFFIFFAVFI